MGQAIKHLKSDHEYIMKSLHIFHHIFPKTGSQTVINHKDLSECIKFNVVFTVMCHNWKEDNILFRYFMERRITIINEEISKYIDEHKLFNIFIMDLQDSLSDNPQGVVTPGFINEFHRYLNHMETHMKNENVILLPTIDEFLSDKEQDAICEQYVQHETSVMKEYGIKDIKSDIDNLYKNYL